LIVDLSLLHPSALERLAKYPKAFVKFFNAANKLLRYNTEFQRLGDQKYISQSQINVIRLLMSGVSTAHGWPSGFNNGASNIANESNWALNTQKGSLFRGVPWHVVEHWIKNATSMKTIQVSGIIAIPTNFQ
jgi:hypothetical protein